MKLAQGPLRSQGRPWVASDCKPFVGYIQKGRGRSCGGITMEMKYQAKTFISCNFIDESGDSNVDARRLARFGLSLIVLHVYLTLEKPILRSKTYFGILHIHIYVITMHLAD